MREEKAADSCYRLSAELSVCTRTLCSWHIANHNDMRLVDYSYKNRTCTESHPLGALLGQGHIGFVRLCPKSPWQPQDTVVGDSHEPYISTHFRLFGQSHIYQFNPLRSIAQALARQILNRASTDTLLE